MLKITKEEAKQLVKAVDERVLTLGKLLTSCLKNEQTEAAGEVKKTVETLSSAREKLQEVQEA